MTNSELISEYKAWKAMIEHGVEVAKAYAYIYECDSFKAKTFKRAAARFLMLYRKARREEFTLLPDNEEKAPLRLMEHMLVCDRLLKIEFSRLRIMSECE